mgnify:CR=1 FL=1
MAVTAEQKVRTPADWATGSLSEFWNVTDCKHVTADFVREGYPLASIREVQSRYVDLSNANQTTEQFFQQLIEGGRQPRPGDLVLSRNATVGEVALVADWHPPFAMGQDVCLLRKRHPDLSSEYLYALFDSNLIRQQFTDFMVGSTFKRANIEQIRSLSVHMPSKQEQKAIALALTDADTLIDSLEQLLTKKRQIKQGAMQELLTGKRRLPGFNAPWTPRYMADLFDFSGGLSASRDQLGSVGSCYLHYGDIHLSSKTYIDLDLEYHLMPRLEIDLREVSPTALLRNGDVVFVDASEDDQGVSKHVAIHCQVVRPLISGLHTIVARPKSDELVDLYKRYCFQAPSVQAQFRFYAVGTKVSGVSKGNIGKIMLDVPSPSEQAEIAACLVEMDAEIDALESRLTKARALKQAMAQALLTGRIRLTEPTT